MSGGLPEGPLPETPDLHGAYPRLTEEHIKALEAVGERRGVARGDVLLREGERSTEFFVLLRGQAVVVSDYFGPDPKLIRVHGPGRFLGELSLVIGQIEFVTTAIIVPGEVVAVPVDRLRELTGNDVDFGDLVLRAYLVRRSMLIGEGAGLRIIGSRFSPDTHRLRDFAARNRLPNQFTDVEEDSDAERLLAGLQVPAEDLPVVIVRGEEVLRNPSNAELAACIGLGSPVPAKEVCDLAVVGAGPAGLAAAVYGASEGLTTVVVDCIAVGGQAATSSRIENYLGFPAGISGAELAERATIQAEKFGARITVSADAVALTGRTATTGSGSTDRPT